MSDLSKFRNIHEGDPIILIGNGENLLLTPPEKFPYPSIGMNTIHLYENKVPDYYVTVDRRVHREFGEEIYEKFQGIPKFVPTPRLDAWQGNHFYRFRHLQGLLWPSNKASLWQDDITDVPIIYANVMHIAIKFAYYMGASVILIVGMEHKPKKAGHHFWGVDSKMSPDQPIQHWLEGYKILCQELKQRDVDVLNISEKTHVSEDIIPTDSWKNWME